MHKKHVYQFEIDCELSSLSQNIPDKQLETLALTHYEYLQKPLRQFDSVNTPVNITGSKTGKIARGSRLIVNDEEDILVQNAVFVMGNRISYLTKIVSEMPEGDEIKEVKDIIKALEKVYGKGNYQERIMLV